MTPDLEVLNLLNAVEIRLILAMDRTWTLPSDANQPRQRMIEAKRRVTDSVPGEWYVRPKAERELEKAERKKARQAVYRAKRRAA